MRTEREKKNEAELAVEAVIYFSVVDKFRPRIFARLEACSGKRERDARRELWFHHRWWYVVIRDLLRCRRLAIFYYA